MVKRIFLVMVTDIFDYPPVISLIRIWLELNYKPYIIGKYSDEIMKKEFEKSGAIFFDTTYYSSKLNIIKKLISILSFRRQTKKVLELLEVKKDEDVWFLNADTISVLYKLIPKYRSILHFYEFVDPVLSFGFWLVSPGYNMGKTMKLANKVVHCEYNRAHITKALYGLDVLPYVFPNKPYITDENITNLPDDIHNMILDFKSRLVGKKVILYQGIFNSTERRLEEFCEAIQNMPEEYVIMIMGEESRYYESLKSRYSSDKVLFIPFVTPPYHMFITQLAHIGILTYFAKSSNYADVINPLYCAPNKIFEYSKFGMPMIGNDIPGLSNVFDKYGCGICLDYPVTPNSIQNAVKSIFDNYNKYSAKSMEYYNSIDLKSIVNKILK